VKKRVLYFIIVLALVLCVTLPMTIPVMASIIDASKDPIPLLPNIYRIGDTIYYEMTVSNPVGNNASNYLTRIWDTLPDGTEIDFLGPGETLIQEPGDTATFYTNYTVAAAYVVWVPSRQYYGVMNHFEAEGLNTYGARVYIHRAAPSRVIRPDTKVTIVDAPATVVSGQEFDLTITEENTGFDELTSPYVEIWKDGAPFATLAAPPTSGDTDGDDILDADETWSWTIQDVSITETTTFVALGFGTDPLGDEVSYAADYLDERDEVTVTALEAGIGIEKYVSVDEGTNWLEADTGPGPTAVVGNEVWFKVRVCNNSTAPLTSISVSDTDLTFTGVVTSLAAGDCDESNIVIVAAVDGPQYDLATVTAQADGVPVSGDDPAYYTGLTPHIDIEKYVSVDGGLNWEDADSTPYPTAVVGNNVSFKVRICNDGEADLSNVVVSDTDFTFIGVVTSLAAGDCDESNIVTVAAVDGLQYDLATVTANADGVPVNDNDQANYTGLTPHIDIEKYVSIDDGLNWEDADSAPYPTPLVGNNVSFKVVICNDGEADLSNVVITDTDFTFTGVASSLSVGDCDESDVVTVAAVDGLQYDLATVNATAEGVPVTDEDPASYFGSPPGPAIDIKKYTNGVDADDPPGPYITIGNTVTWKYVVKNTGDVDLTDVVVTDDQLGQIGSTILLLPVDGTATLHESGTAVAGQYANNGTVIGYYGTANVTDWDLSHYFGRNVTPPVGWETYPINKVRVLLPWIILLAALIAGASLLVLRHRRVTL
jgi:uncharacterized repeat protein (TIGR01451 family)